LKAQLHQQPDQMQSESHTTRLIAAVTVFCVIS